MFLPKLREVTEALKSLFSAPYTTKFPAGAYTPCPQYRGFPKYFEEHCVGCGTCAQVCPPGAIEMRDDIGKGIRTLEINYASCIQCGQCEEKCITGEGIKLTQHFAVSSMKKDAPENFERVEKELVACELCGEPIACRDHLLFIRERMGAKAYAHPTLLLEIQKEFTAPGPANPKARVRREDLVKQICPICRHKIVVADEF